MGEPEGPLSVAPREVMIERMIMELLLMLMGMGMPHIHKRNNGLSNKHIPNRSSRHLHLHLLYQQRCLMDGWNCRIRQVVETTMQIKLLEKLVGKNLQQYPNHLQHRYLYSPLQLRLRPHTHEMLS